MKVGKGTGSCIGLATGLGFLNNNRSQTFVGVEIGVIHLKSLKPDICCILVGEIIQDCFYSLEYVEFE